jgi:hypothetical protein
MAKRGSNEVGLLLVDGYDLLGVTTTLTDNIEAVLEEVTVFGEDWAKQAYTGLKSAEISQEGFYDDASHSSNAALAGQSGVNRILCYGIEGNTIGQKFIAYSGALQTNYSRIASRGEIHRANANYQGSGSVEEGKILANHAIREAANDTTGTPVSRAAQTTGGGAAYLQVSALDLDGATNTIIKVLHSTDLLAWDDLVTFDAVTAAPAVQRKVVTGTVRKHLAVSWAYTGGMDPEPVIKFMVGFKRK